MPVSEKPGKKYRPRPVVKPMNIRNRWMTEGDCHALLLAMEGGTFCEQHLADLVAHADIVHRIARRRGDDLMARHAESLFRTAVDIQARNLEKGAIVVTGLEEAAIRASMSLTLDFIAGASNADILAAAQSALRGWGRDERRA